MNGHLGLGWFLSQQGFQVDVRAGRVMRGVSQKNISYTGMIEKAH
jgi:hypothetical protein